VGLSGSAENIDAVAVLSDGRLLISTTGAVSVSGASGQDEDLLAFTPTSLGATTAGSWSLYFDGSDVGLSTNDNEDINALDIQETGGLPSLFFSTLGAFSVTGVSGADEDIFAFTPSSLGGTTAGTFGPGLAFDGSTFGLGSFGIDGFHIGTVPPPAAPLGLAATGGSGDAVASALAANATSSAPASAPAANNRTAAVAPAPAASSTTAAPAAVPTTASAPGVTTTTAATQSGSTSTSRRLLAELVDAFFGSFGA
jgi:hypothetical protein